MNKCACLFALLTLAACATPITTLKHPKTKQIATCGGDSTASMAGGLIGYNIQQNSDARCVESYEKEGFKVIGRSKE